MRSRIARILILVAAAFSLLMVGACGYRLGDGGGTSMRPRLFVELFENRTARAFVNDIVSAAVIERFRTSSLFEIVEDKSKADLVLSGTILRYKTDPIAYSRDDTIKAYRVALEIRGNVISTRPEQGRLWSGDLTGDRDFYADTERVRQQHAERRSVEQLAMRLADDLYQRVADELIATESARRP